MKQRLMWFSILLCVLSGYGCNTRMANEDIVAEVKYCTENGLAAVSIRTYDGIIVGIQCGPCKKGE